MSVPNACNDLCREKMCVRQQSVSTRCVRFEVANGFPVAVHRPRCHCVALEKAETRYSFDHSARLDGSAESWGSDRDWQSWRRYRPSQMHLCSHQLAASGRACESGVSEVFDHAVHVFPLWRSVPRRTPSTAKHFRQEGSEEHRAQQARN